MQNEELVLALLRTLKEVAHRLCSVALPTDKGHVVPHIHPAGAQDVHAALLLDVENLVETVLGKAVLRDRAGAQADLPATMGLVEDAPWFVVDLGQLAHLAAVVGEDGLREVAVGQLIGGVPKPLNPVSDSVIEVTHRSGK